MSKLDKKGVIYFSDTKMEEQPQCLIKGELIGRGLLLKILRDIEIKREDFIKWLEER